MKGRLKEIRASENLTQDEFGQRLNLSRNYIAQIETGAKEISDRTIRDICREFGVSELWLRDGVGEMYLPRTREQEMAELVKSLMADSPESFRSALVTTLLRFDPDGPEWEILERIYNNIAAEMEKAPEE